MKNNAAKLWSLLRYSSRSFFFHLGPLKAGSIAFFATLSLFPLGLLLISVAGRAIGSAQAYHQVAAVIREYLPGADAQVLAVLRQARAGGGRLLVDLAGMLALAWSAMNLFAALSQVLTVVWFGEPKRGFVRRRLVSLAAVLAAGLLFFASAIVASLLAALSSYAARFGAIAALAPHLRLLNSAAAWALHAALAALMFFLLYWTMPAGRVAARAAAAAALPAALLWMISRSVFAVLVAGSSRYGQVYGSLAGMVGLLLWIYYSAYIMIFCGEIGSALQSRRWPANTAPRP
jgi:membrane protein